MNGLLFSYTVLYDLSQPAEAEREWKNKSLIEEDKMKHAPGALKERLLLPAFEKQDRSKQRRCYKHKRANRGRLLYANDRPAALFHPYNHPLYNRESPLPLQILTTI